ncbi:AAA family ATPase [Pseudomonas sp. TE21394]
MRFQIEKVQADGEWVPLSDRRISSENENIFTMVVGQNAVGKSRLLRKIVSNYIFSHVEAGQHHSESAENYVSLLPRPVESLFTYEQLPSHISIPKTDDIALTIQPGIHRKEIPWSIPPTEIRSISSYRMPKELAVDSHGIHKGEVLPSLDSKWHPAHVIAVSTGRHDRFPSTLQYKRRAAPINYSYIGTERPHGSSVPSSLASLIDGLIKGHQNIKKLSKIFEYLGFIPYLDLKISLDIKQLYKLSEAERLEIYQNCDYEILAYLSEYGDYPPHVSPQELHFYESLKRQKRSHIEVNFWNIESGRGHGVLGNIAPLLKAGLIKIYDVTLIKSADKSRLRLSQASSGQQCMITIMLGIAGSIQNCSLICIDEPEISLHPQWQSNMVQQLQEVFSDFHGCHFVIATHSPQLVSGLVTESGYVLNLEEKKLYHSFEYAQRSADFQLAEIFHTPGKNNEYLLRITLLLLTKITRREQLNKEDIETISKLYQLRGKMSDTDPVYHLIGQIEALY